ncbi:MAG: sigma 54-interacting transcriptional regulator [Desulfosudis oleivorans]|nr:sigma 54-interacting transcriptional regulator [Desulfosudis oleivorans]
MAETDVSVLIEGESGTGKELVARALHYKSRLRDKPFVKVNCAALPHELLESELFGYERGAFTGAYRSKPGKFELANNGTIFLDEIGEMDLGIQSKLLQVLQEGTFSRLGGKQDVQVNVRVITATNRDLKKAIENGTFREDIYYRLNVVSINIPPLTDRKEDITYLFEYFLDTYNEKYGKNITGQQGGGVSPPDGLPVAGQCQGAQEPGQAARHPGQYRRDGAVSQGRKSEPCAGEAVSRRRRTAVLDMAVSSDPDEIVPLKLAAKEATVKAETGDDPEGSAGDELEQEEGGQPAAGKL